MTSNTRKPIFFTSDWHLGHDKALQFDERPFRDMAHQIEVLITRFNATVPENGVTYFLGDMGFKPAGIKEVMDKLNGVKVLILGNHDRNMNSMYNAGFDVVQHGAVLNIQGQRVSLSHCPLLDVYREDTSVMLAYKEVMPGSSPPWHGNDRAVHRSLSTVDNGQFHLHGHIHSRKERAQSKKIEGRQYDVGVTANNYTPVSISQIESWIANHVRTRK